jgi:hypothetical protein
MEPIVGTEGSDRSMIERGPATEARCEELSQQRVHVFGSTTDVLSQKEGGFAYHVDARCWRRADRTADS